MTVTAFFGSGAVIPTIAVRLVGPAERCFEVLEFFLFSWDKIDAENIEARRRERILRELVDVLSRQAAEGIALVGIDGDFSGRNVVRGAGLDFNKAKHGAMPGDEVEIPGQIAGGPAPRHHCVAFAAQMEKRRILAVNAGGEMRGLDCGATSTVGNPLQSGKSVFETGNADLLEPSHRRPLSALRKQGANRNQLNGTRGLARRTASRCSVERQWGCQACATSSSVAR